MSANAANEHVTYLSDEEIDRRADFKVDASNSSWYLFAACRKVRFLWWSWWQEVFRSNDLERCVEHVQQLAALPRRYSRRVVPKP